MGKPYDVRVVTEEHAPGLMKTSFWRVNVEDEEDVLLYRFVWSSEMGANYELPVEMGNVLKHAREVIT